MNQISNLVLLVYFSFLFILGCTKQEKPIVIDKPPMETTTQIESKQNDIYLSKYKFKDSLFSIEEGLNYKKYSMKLVTVYEKDSVDPSEEHLFEPIIVYQKFKFYKENKFLRSEVIPIKIIRQKVTRGPVKKMLACVFFAGQIARLKNGDLVYHVIGYGGCNADCPNCDAVFSLNGKLIALSYRSPRRVIIESGLVECLDEINDKNLNSRELKSILFGSH